jgi:cytochrome c oxidase subunit 2
MAEERPQVPQPESERLGDIESKKAKPWLLAAIVLVFSAIGIAIGLWIDWMPRQTSTQLDDINTLYDVLIIASVPIFVLVQGYVVYAIWRWRMRKGEEDKDGPPIHGNTRLEVIWTAIPAVLMLGLTTYSYIVLKDIEEAPAKGDKPELNVRVVGEQFTWTFYYPPAEKGGKEVASNQLYVPIDRSVKFKVQAKDVLHDFWVPNWGMKIDAVPGIDTFYRVTPTRQGNYPVVCAELCGLGHAVMRQTARVVSGPNFEEWLSNERAGGEDPVAGGGGRRPGDVDGKTLFTTVEPTCGSCHTLADAGTESQIGPNLEESLKGKDTDYIRAGITEPDRDIAEGFQPGIMPPNYDQTLDPEEVDALVEYLEKVANG